MACVTSTSLSLAKGSHVAILKLKGEEKYNSTICLRAENIWIALVTIIVLLHTNDKLNLMPPSHYLANCVAYILSYIDCIPLRCQALCPPVWMMASSSSSGWGRDRIGHDDWIGYEILTNAMGQLYFNKVFGLCFDMWQLIEKCWHLLSTYYAQALGIQRWVGDSPHSRGTCSQIQGREAQISHQNSRCQMP